MSAVPNQADIEKTLLKAGSGVRVPLRTGQCRGVAGRHKCSDKAITHDGEWRARHGLSQPSRVANRCYLTALTGARAPCMLSGMTPNLSAPASRRNTFPARGPRGAAGSRFGRHISAVGGPAGRRHAPESPCVAGAPQLSRAGRSQDGRSVACACWGPYRPMARREGSRRSRWSST